MFEVDWADYDCERVGQRRARKDAERQSKEKEDASSGHRTKSTRTSTSSDPQRRSFFGSMRRKKTNDSSTRGEQQEPSTLNSVSSKSDLKLKRGSLGFLRAGGSSITKPPDSVSVVFMDERHDARSLVEGKRATDSQDHTWSGCDARSSK
ncbi:hypothetical protein N658DRAFT_556602, partial [Parathielavia hyrcaniae]